MVGEIIAGVIVYGLMLIGTNFLSLREQLIHRWRSHRENGIQVDTLAPVTLMESQ